MAGVLGCCEAVFPPQALGILLGHTASWIEWNTRTFSIYFLPENEKLGNGGIFQQDDDLKRVSKSLTQMLNWPQNQDSVMTFSIRLHLFCFRKDRWSKVLRDLVFKYARERDTTHILAKYLVGSESTIVCKSLVLILKVCVFYFSNKPRLKAVDIMLCSRFSQEQTGGLCCYKLDWETMKHFYK